jgi:hypothetical protein
MNRIYVSIFFFFIGIVPVFSQDNNTRAIGLFIEAEDDFSNRNFKSAVSKLDQCLEVLGKPNSKILYLKIRALNFLWRNNFLFTRDLDSSLKSFYQITDKSNYPAEKYIEVVQIGNSLESFKKDDSLFFDKYSRYNFNKDVSKDVIRTALNNYRKSNSNSYYINDINKLIQNIDDLKLAEYTAAQKEKVRSERREKRGKIFGMLTIPVAVLSLLFTLLFDS